MFNKDEEYVPYRKIKNLPLADYEEKGVYAIILGDKIYIGSTTKGFLYRYNLHMSKTNKLCTKNMLENGATFNIIWRADKDCTDEEIRMMEQEYIDYYKTLPQWKVMNKKKASKGNYKIIKVMPELYAKAVELLNNNGIPSL